MSNIKIAGKFRDALTENGVTVFRFLYTLSQPVGGVVDGGISVDLEGLTETEANALIQQSIADDANAQTSNVEAFTVNDVRGGRI